MKHTVYMVRLSNGTYSGVLATIPDVASWIEDNWTPEVRNAKITTEIRNVDHLLENHATELLTLNKRREFLEKETKGLKELQAKLKAG